MKSISYIHVYVYIHIRGLIMIAINDSNVALSFVDDL